MHNILDYDHYKQFIKKKKRNREKFTREIFEAYLPQESILP